DPQRSEAKHTSVGNDICRFLQIERRLRKVSGEARFAQEQCPLPERNSGDLPHEAGSGDSLGSQEDRIRFLSSGNLIAPRLGVLDDEGKESRVQYAENIQNDGSCRLTDQHSRGETAIPK